MAITTKRPWCSGGTNGNGGAGMMVAIVESSSGAASASAMNDVITRGRRQDQGAAHDRVDLVQPELEAGRHAEVAAPPRMAQNRSG